jgi:hypothetical protein
MDKCILHRNTEPSTDRRFGKAIFGQNTDTSVGLSTILNLLWLRVTFHIPETKIEEQV